MDVKSVAMVTLIKMFKKMFENILISRIVSHKISTFLGSY